MAAGRAVLLWCACLVPAPARSQTCDDALGAARCGTFAASGACTDASYIAYMQTNCVQTCGFPPCVAGGAPTPAPATSAPPTPVPMTPPTAVPPTPSPPVPALPTTPVPAEEQAAGEDDEDDEGTNGALVALIVVLVLCCSLWLSAGAGAFVYLSRNKAKAQGGAPPTGPVGGYMVGCSDPALGVSLTESVKDEQVLGFGTWDPPAQGLKRDLSVGTADVLSQAPQTPEPLGTAGVPSLLDFAQREVAAHPQARKPAPEVLATPCIESFARGAAKRPAAPLSSSGKEASPRRTLLRPLNAALTSRQGTGASGQLILSARTMSDDDI
eukprot:TRINITY_DN21229_c0_g1_i1.p1 TRINITY_DN21229_c0_g1~~TRINITY_DN21229_c0_g1_i1.p1  ORF type:complete len:326 (+),score=46.95 TRINITY_DN21229_c0_g1_i1:59-1036(+)